MSNNDINEESINKNIENTAIPFITFNQTTKKFIINEDAKTILSNPKYKKIGIISLVGKYRTGKSFLLNRVLINNNKNLNTTNENDSTKNTENNNNNNENNTADNSNADSQKKISSNSLGFDVGPTINPCTKGIWLWSTPLMISNTHSKDEEFPVFIIDTEGLGAYDEEINHDSKIFLIAILLSSLFIYNSFGTIDETALNNLSLIVNLSKSLKLRENSNSKKNSNLFNDIENDDSNVDLNKYFPVMLWILRDFILKLEDQEGNVITAKQYLENALTEQKGNTSSIIEKNIVRKLIKKFFPERDCFPMVRPLENEIELQNLNHLPDEKIRPEFLEQCVILRNKILMKVRPKNFNGKNLSGENLINYLNNIIESINKGSIPVIEDSWKYVINNELMKSIQEYVEIYRKKIKDFQEQNFNEKNDYFHLLKEFNQNLIEQLKNNFIEENKHKFENNSNDENNNINDNNNEYVEKLVSNLQNEFKKINESNISLFKEKYIQIFDSELSKIIDSNINNNKNENHIQFINELLQLKDKVDNLIPDFSLKNNISFDKIISTIKKYIEDIFIKKINSIEKNFNTLKNENEILTMKNNDLNNEYNKDKIEFKNTVDKYNEMLIEYKLKNKSFEEKIKNFENEKKILKENNDINISNINKENESKNEKMYIEINKLKNEIKSKEEEILLNKLNNEKVSALNVQKINFLEKEVENWKNRNNDLNKEFKELKNNNLNLSNENEKLKNEILNLQLKDNNNNNNNENNNTNNNNINKKTESLNNSMLINILKDTSKIKEMLFKLFNNKNGNLNNEIDDNFYNTFSANSRVFKNNVINNNNNINFSEKKTSNEIYKRNNINLNNNNSNNIINKTFNHKSIDYNNNNNNNNNFSNFNSNNTNTNNLMNIINNNNNNDINDDNNYDINNNNNNDINNNINNNLINNINNNNNNSENLDNQQSYKNNILKTEINNNNNNILYIPHNKINNNNNINSKPLKTAQNINIFNNNNNYLNNNNLNTNPNINMNNINKIYNSYKNNINNNNNNNNNYNNNNISNNNNNFNNNNNILINICGSKLKKDENDKPFIDYLIEVKKNNEVWRLHKKFIQFAILNKNIKNIIKDKIPQSESIFNNIINDQKVFHENKISQLDKYIKDLLNINGIEKIESFRNFFELDENRLNKNGNFKNNCNSSSISSNNNTFINNNNNDINNNVNVNNFNKNNINKNKSSIRKNTNMNIKKNNIKK